MRQIAQERSEFALERVLALEKVDRKEFKSFVAGVPSMILQNGFGQTLAFLLAKGANKNMQLNESDKHVIILHMVVDWLCKKEYLNCNNNQRGDEKLKNAVLNLSKMEQKEYLAAQEEALKLLEWIKRYASVDWETENE